MAPNSGLLQVLARLAAAAALAFAAAAPAGAACVGGGISPEPPPAVDFLRSYRASFGSPARVAAGPGGRLYVTDPTRGRVLVRAEDGRVLAEATGLGRPVSVAADGEGRAFVGDGVAGRVTAYGERWQRLFDLGQGDGEFLFPGDLAVDPATGRVYVADTRAHQVKVYDRGGRPLAAIGALGEAEGLFRFPAGLFLDSARGELWVVDQHNFRLQVFSLDGAFLFCVGTPVRGFIIRSSLFEMPQGVWVDAAGRVFVTDSLAGEVKVLDRNGASLGAIGGFGEGPGELRTPTGLAMDRLGRLFVATAGSNRLDVFGVGGYTDAERFMPAVVALEPATADRRERRGVITAYLEVPGYDLSLVNRDRIRANGVRGRVAAEGDRDGNGIPDLTLEFRRAPLLARMQPGDNAVVVEAPLGGMTLIGSAALQVTDSGPGRGGRGDEREDEE